MTSEDFFKHIEKQFHGKLPFVAYKKPNTSLVKGMLQFDDVLHAIGDFTESGFVFAPFDSNQDAFLIPLEHSEMLSFHTNENDFSEVEMRLEKQSDLVNNTKEQDKLSHIKHVEKGIDAIKDGHFLKVVLSRRETLEHVETNPIEIFERLLQRYPTALVYVWYHPKVGMWLGATPETLLSVRGNHLKTMALAGTQAFEGVTDVVWKEKEKEEQQIVTDFIVESLRESVSGKKSAVGSFQSSVSGRRSSHDNSHPLNDNIKVSGPKTVKAGNLLHLQTEISMSLKPEKRNLKPILEALHPTPAVCGFPKEKAKTFILENEGYSREFYAGFLGELHLKETISRNTNRRNVENDAYSVQKSVSNLYVNLRCMQITNQNIHIYVGGGITKDSDAKAEWEETVHKSQIIKSVL